jgi:hypothetical protein
MQKPELAFTKKELEVLYAVPNNKLNDNIQNNTLPYYLKSC